MGINSSRLILIGLSVLCIAVVVWSRFGFLTENFGNFDVAGIVYNAELILDGGMPYRDTFEIKPPFLFYLFALIFQTFEPSLIYVRLIWGVWLLVSCALIYGICRRLYDLEKEKFREKYVYRDIFPALAALLLAVYGTMFDINYASWLVLPLSLSVYAFIRAQKGHATAWLLVCGASASIAFLTKNPGGFVVVVFLILKLGRVLRKPSWKEIKRAMGVLILIAVGCLLALLPLVAYYGLQGELRSLINGLLPGWILKGVLSAKTGSSGSYLVFQNLGRGLVQVFRLFPLPTISVLIVMAVMLIRRSFLGLYGFFALTWFVVSFFSVVITGGRFYPHHAVLYLPSLVVLAVHPGVVLEIIRSIRKIQERWLKSAATAGCLLIVFIGFVLAYQNISQDNRRFYDWPAPVGKPEPQRIIGELIRKNTKPDDTIIAWGWFAWPVYHWSGRRSPSPVYKEMGILTTVSTNTEWTLSSPIHFVPSQIADQYLRDVKAKRPAFVVISNWYPFISRTEPLLEFAGLVAFLKEDYIIQGDLQGFRILRRKDHPLRTALR